jgi:predicted site-specific integrase-resolvase
MRPGGTMGTAEREWVSLKEAAEQFGISLTTIRDWSRAGDVECRETGTGRLVDLAQVRDKAMGPAAPRKRPSDLQDRVADGAGQGDESGEDLANSVQELQALARDRHS